jgi:hypothetical protein
MTNIVDPASMGGLQFESVAPALAFAVADQSIDRPAAIAPDDPPCAIRAEAAELVRLCAEAATVGIKIDAIELLTSGAKPDALCQRIADEKIEADRARSVISIGSLPLPSGAGSQIQGESPLLAEARRTSEETLSVYKARQFRVGMRR